MANVAAGGGGPIPTDPGSFGGGSFWDSGDTPPPPPGDPGTIDYLQGQLDEAHAGLEACRASLNKSLCGELDRCQAQIDHCSGCVAGHGENLLADATLKLSKVLDKIEAHLVGQIGLCYALAAPYGVFPPQPAQEPHPGFPEGQPPPVAAPVPIPPVAPVPVNPNPRGPIEPPPEMPPEEPVPPAFQGGATSEPIPPGPAGGSQSTGGGPTGGRTGDGPAVPHGGSDSVTVDIPDVPPIAPARFARRPKIDAGLKKPPEWCPESVCAEVAQWVQGEANNPAGAFLRFLGFNGALGDTFDGTIAGIISRVEQSLLEKDGTIGLKAFPVEILKQIIWALGNVGEFVLDQAPLPPDVPANAAKTMLARKMLKQALAKFSGIDLEFPGSFSQYTLNYMHPTLILSGGEALSACLSDRISLRQYFCYCAANGICKYTADRNLQASKYKLGIGEAVEWWLREPGQDQWLTEQLRAQGVLDEDEQRYIRKLTDWRPDLGTLVDWMDRGILDDEESADHKADTNFARSYTDAVKEQLRHSGVNEADAKHLWRAHWTRPDIQTAYTMLHRFRPGAVPKELEYTPAMLREAIRASDARPDQWDRLEALAYPPLGIRQLTVVYNLGAITHEQLIGYLQDNGWKEADARLLGVQFIRHKIDYERAQMGAPSGAAAVKAFATGDLTTAELQSELQGAGYSASLAEKTLAQARVERQRHGRSKIIAAVKKRYMAGEISDAWAGQAMRSAGMDAEGSVELMREWRAELEVHPKQIGASELLAWYEKGLLGSDELVSRLAQMRYSMADISRIIAAADLKNWDKVETDAEKDLSEIKGKVKASKGTWSAALSRLDSEFKDISKKAQTPVGKIFAGLSKELKPLVKKTEPPKPPKGKAAANGTQAAPAPADTAAPVATGTEGPLTPTVPPDYTLRGVGPVEAVPPPPAAKFIADIVPDHVLAELDRLAMAAATTGTQLPGPPPPPTPEPPPESSGGGDAANPPDDGTVKPEEPTVTDGEILRSG